MRALLLATFLFAAAGCPPPITIEWIPGHADLGPSSPSTPSTPPPVVDGQQHDDMARAPGVDGGAGDVDMAPPPAGDLAPACGGPGQPCCTSSSSAACGAGLRCYNRSQGLGGTVDLYCITPPSTDGLCGDVGLQACDELGHVAARTASSPYGYCNDGPPVESIFGSLCDPNANH